MRMDASRRWRPVARERHQWQTWMHLILAGRGVLCLGLLVPEMRQIGISVFRRHSDVPLSIPMDDLFW